MPSTRTSSSSLYTKSSATNSKHVQSDSAVGSFQDIQSLASSSQRTPGSKGTKGASRKPALPPSQYDNYFIDAKKQFLNKLHHEAAADHTPEKPDVSAVKHLIEILKRTDHNQYTDALIKRHKALRKRIDRIEKYEHNDVSSLNKDQKDSLVQLPCLRGGIKEVEDMILLCSEMHDVDRDTAASHLHTITALNATIVRFAEKVEEHGRVFQLYTKLIKELVDLDQDDVTVSQLRDLFLTEGQAVYDLTKRVLEKDPAAIAGVDEVVTYENVYTRLIESPLRIEDLLTPPDFMASDDHDNDEAAVTEEFEHAEEGDAEQVAELQEPMMPSFMATDEIVEQQHQQVEQPVASAPRTDKPTSYTKRPNHRHRRDTMGIPHDHTKHHNHDHKHHHHHQHSGEHVSEDRQHPRRPPRRTNRPRSNVVGDESSLNANQTSRTRFNNYNKRRPAKPADSSMHINTHVPPSPSNNLAPSAGL